MNPTTRRLLKDHLKVAKSLLKTASSPPPTARTS